MNSEQYAEKIKHTKADIDETLHTLEDKLSPKELWDQALKWSEGAKEFSINLSRTVRENPVPAALMGISLVWLMATGASKKLEGELPEIKNKFQHKYEEMKSTIKDTTTEAGDRLKAVSADLKYKGEHWREQGQELTGKLQAKSSELSARPVLLSAFGLALGALAAMSLPLSRQEQEVMGETVDQLRDKTSQFVGEQLEKGKEAASAAVEAAKEKLGGMEERTGQWTAEKQKAADVMGSSTH